MTELVGIAAVAVVAWFAAGTIVNVRKGRALMRWMQDGLPVLGERTTVRWLGSTVVEMTIREARPPFASVTVVVFLEPRDLPWGRLLRRRDTLIVRGMLRRAPEVEFEVLDPASWSGREAAPRVPPEWQARPAGAAGGLVVHHSSAEGVTRAGTLLAAARDARLDAMRLAARRGEPHFQLHVPLPDTGRPARGYFEAVSNLAERAAT
jgi:hypothetical protein